METLPGHPERPGTGETCIHTLSYRGVPGFLCLLYLSVFVCQTALHMAVVVGHRECVCALLKAGASVELQERGGNTALHLAVCELQAECVRELTNTRRNLSQLLNIYNYDGTHTHTNTALRETPSFCTSLRLYLSVSPHSLCFPLCASCLFLFLSPVSL